MARTRRQQGAAPSSGAGLMRYFDVDSHGPKMSPKFLMSIVITIIILEVIISSLI